MKWLVFVLIIEFVNSLNCVKPSFDNLTVQSNFDLTKFLGLWYEIEWLSDTPHNESDIWRNFYHIFQLQNSSTNRLLVPGGARLLNVETCFPVDPLVIIANNSAKMLLETKDTTSADLLYSPYYILKTDYETYALIYACISPNYTTNNSCINPALWLFSRTTSISVSQLTELDIYIENQLCINLTALEITPQDGKSCYSSSSSNKCIWNFVLFVILFFLYI